MPTTTERFHTFRQKSEISQRQEFLAIDKWKLKVKALLDDASTKTQINADVADELGL